MQLRIAMLTHLDILQLLELALLQDLEESIPSSGFKEKQHF